ncbi:GNAT family N-acetyltransferase [Streptomyces sp. NPDC058646]|uniref:GNAT family N-acetyltransferase n=1 Tax=Streptomyces sp. NPDC058646 TaxID=3346574 RepID=UPI003651BCA2
MMIHSLTPPPSDAEVDRWLAVLTATAATDLPDLPPPARVETAGRLCVAPVRGRPFLWTADDGAGVAGLLLFSEEANRHTAFLDVLAVRPDARRRGVGTALWERVRRELLADGRTSVATMVDLGGPGQAFAEAVGFENVLPMAWYVQDVPEPRTVEVPATPGYTLMTWHGLTPDDRVRALAVAHGAMADAPTGDLDQRNDSWGAERLHAVQRLALDRGGELTTVAAVTDAGEVAAYTVVVLPDPGGPRAVQYDTVVVPGHRGHGLGRAVKQHMLREAAERYPGLRTIATTVADENIPMRTVNEALGYRHERDTALFQYKVQGPPAR